MAQRIIRIQQSLKVAAEAADINGLYGSIKEDPLVLDRIDAIPFVDTPLHIAASAGHTDFAIEILRLKPSFGRKLNPDGLSSLHLALISDKFETVKRLIKFDKELIRVKGRKGVTPLHFIARNINADQQQRVVDQQQVADPQQRVVDQQQRGADGSININADQEQGVADQEERRINILAEFLFACPNSIEDLTNQDKTALHIAVKTRNQRAVQVILGCIQRIDRKRVLDYKDKEGNTALRTAESQSPSQPEIVSSLRRAGALECSSPDPSLAEFLNSPERRLEVVYKLVILLRRSVSMELRNIGLVVAGLIATTTFTAVLSPPGGVGGPGNNNLLTNGTSINATNHLFAAANTSFINATFFIPTTDDPVIRLTGHVQDPYGYFFLQFYCLNTLAFVLSMLMIMFALPFQPFFPLHCALYILMGSYGIAFSAISPSNDSAEVFQIFSIVCASLIYACRGAIYLISLLGKAKNKRLRMLRRLLNNVEQ